MDLWEELEKLKKKSNVIEVLVFGSAAKGKPKPRDVDVAVIAKEKINLDLPDTYHATQITLEDLISDKPIVKTIFHEGVRLDGSGFLEKLGFRSMFMYTYNLEKLKPSDKSRFSHALYGRTGEGILKDVNGLSLGKGAILVPTEKDGLILDFFKTWKVDFTRKRVLIEI